MSFLDIFNNGMSELSDQQQALDTLTAELLQQTTKVKGSIDLSVNKLELAREAKQAASENLTWLRLEINTNNNHTYKELAELFSKETESEQALRVFRALTIELKPKAIDSVKGYLIEYEDHLESYRMEIDTFRDLIHTHKNEKTEPQLLEILEKYEKVFSSQKSTINQHLEPHELGLQIR